MTHNPEQPPVRRRGLRWILLTLAVASGVAVGWVAYRVRTACPAVQRGRLADVEYVHGIAVGTDGRTLFLAAYDGLFRGERLGQAWRPVRSLCRTDVTAVAAPGATHTYVAGHSLGVMVSRDGGSSFQPAGSGLPAADVHGLAVDPQDPNRVYAWVVGSGLWVSADAGKAWAPVAAGALAVEDVYQLLAHPERPNVLYAAGAAGIARSDDGGKTWSRLPGWSGAAYGLAVRPGQPERLFVAGGVRGVHYTDDGGRTWRPGGNLAGEFTAVTVHPQNPRWVLAATATGRLYESRDGGELWSPR